VVKAKAELETLTAQRVGLGDDLDGYRDYIQRGCHLTGELRRGEQFRRRTAKLEQDLRTAVPLPLVPHCRWPPATPVDGPGVSDGVHYGATHTGRRSEEADSVIVDLVHCGVAFLLLGFLLT
jgi:hypothetical protein